MSITSPRVRGGSAILGGAAPADAGPPAGKLLALTIAALGVVYGDIGTSPLYALRECFFGEPASSVPPRPENVLGILSLFFWSLTIVVTLKYVTLLLRADNGGEGGILSLAALLPSLRGRGPADPRIPVTVVFACLGAALLLGDGMITPAISVLSAVEGVRLAADVPDGVVVGATCVILVALFAVQRRGTSRVGAFFGPVMVVWFFVIAALGARQIVRHPNVLRALLPTHAIGFLETNGLHSFGVLGAVVLCVTGGEALYADMGHFGRRPIRRAWFALVLPALLMSYFGQGAYLLHTVHPEENTFFALVPALPVLRWAMVVLATAATVIASQALISGAYSLSRQAVQLGLFPRVTVRHTSGSAEGQIYVPEINWLLMVACLALVLTFRRSTALAGAYGLAVTGTMALTSGLCFEVLRRHFGWSTLRASAVVAPFLAADLAFFGATSLKILDGGFVPVVLAAGIFVVMTTWRKGRARLAGWVLQHTLPIDELVDRIRRQRPQRVRGTAVFMTSNPNGVPPVLAHHWEHNKALHAQVVLLSVVSVGTPIVPVKDRLTVVDRGEGIYQLEARFGFMQTPDVPQVMRLAALRGLRAEPATTTYYLGRESIIEGKRGRMSRWRMGLFAWISRNARPATQYFGIPPDRVVELGIQIEL